MSLFTESSLCLVPSGVKDGKVYSIKPTDGSGDLTFSRGSDIEATRVASNGYIQKAKVNVLLQSNSFDTTWTNFQSTETGGQSGYDGTNDAWKLTRLVDGANGVLYQTGLSFSLATFSVYAKAAEENWIYIEIVGSTFPAQYFDLQNGVKGTASGIGFIDSSIEAVSGATGWYRISITANVSSGSRVSIYNATADNTLSGSVNNGVFIQDAQLNYGLVAQEYQETTTTSVVSGITNDMPRLDYSGGASCPSLLLEPSRTNIVTSSEYLAGSSWQNVGCTITTNAATSPEGVDNATLLVGTGGGSARIQDFFGALSGNHTFSVYIKSTGTATRVNFQTNDVGGATFSVPASGAPTLYAEGTNVGDPFIEDAGNGWYRVGFTFTPTGGVVSTYFQIYPDSANNLSSVYAYGAQAEANASFATSYLPTYGTSATRTAESCSKTGISSLIGQTEGTIYANVGAIVSGSIGADFCSIDDGTGSNRIHMFYNTSSKFGLYSEAGGSTQWLFTSDNTSTGNDKLAIAYKSNDAVFYINGVQVGTTSSFVVPSTTTYRIADRFDEAVKAQVFESKQALLFKTRLSNSDLAAITSL